MGTTQVIILNGPPGSGKDVIAKEIVRLHSGAKHVQFKEILYDHTADLFDVDLNWFRYVSNDRAKKELPNEKLQLPVDLYQLLCNYLGVGGEEIETGSVNISPREALIYTSELHYKPRYGKDYFGKKAAENLSEGVLNVFSDGGFKEEVYPIVQKVGYNNLTLVHLHRQGKTFKGDSRQYVTGIPGIVPVGVWNNGTVKEAAEEILSLVK